ncbi:hypothetical protein [Aestuariibacter salexigens]|uniref:hypothetical protein n=1 Tax=Aestuariibacter salexigens TaxID=226010 RepID=UPI00040F14D3|nr:hypothetical protein [Aestuariibacter salexigens]
MTKLDKEQVIAAFTEAYTAANGKAPEIEAKGGWYSVDGGKNVRLAQLQEMTEELSGGAAKAAEPLKAKAEEKPAAAKKPAKAKPAKAKKSASSFSVKAYWAEQVLSHKPGSRAPR